MSWKELLLIFFVVCAVLMLSMARHFLGHMIFLAEHLVAMSVTHTPGFVHFVAGQLR